MKVLLMRHGRTAGNLAKRYIGRTDEPPPRGRKACEGDGRRPRCHARVRQPHAPRAETAAIKFPNAEQIVVDDLREMDFGDFEGLTADELTDSAAYSAWLESECLDACPNGESGAGFIERTCRCFDQLVRSCIARGEEELIIVAHGGTVMSVLFKFAEEKRPFYKWYAGNACYYRAALDEASWFEHPALFDVEYCEFI